MVDFYPQYHKDINKPNQQIGGAKSGVCSMPVTTPWTKPPGSLKTVITLSSMTT